MTTQIFSTSFVNKNVSSQNEPAWHIALISASILILELSFIRLIPAEVRAISYFTNLILIAAFFGMGFGCICQKQRSLSWILPSGLVLILCFLIIGRGIVVYEKAIEVHYWLQYADIKGEAYKIPLFPAATAIFILSALPFVAMGQALARVMDRFHKLIAYGWDIAGSLAGTLIFVLSSLVLFPPWIWPPILMLMWSFVFVRTILKKLVYSLSGVLFIFLAISPYPSSWSPYYYVQYAVESHGIRVWVNSSFHQFGIDFKSQKPSSQDMQQLMIKKWGRPYQLYRDLNSGHSPKKVLILGAGTGNDINIALLNDVTEIVAVEIDPTILSLGKKYNTANPYGDKRVKTHVDDARHFLKMSQEKFDMIVFGTLDSQTLLSNQANLRLESYIYTKESMEDVRSLLTDRGMVAVYYSVFKPWLWKRLYATVSAAFGEHTKLYHEKNQFLFNTLIVGTKEIREFYDLKKNIETFEKGVASTDDWPFIYLKYPTIAPIYMKFFVVVFALILGVFFYLRKTQSVTGLHANFLFLGMGFTLTESSAIVRLSLVFGNTWLVNAVVFTAVLLTIFLANFAVLKKKAPMIEVAWIGLILFILLNYFFPTQLLFKVGTVLRVGLCILLVGTPVFFAAVCFSHIFKKQSITGYPLGINLIGAMAGGIIEYVSMVGGIRVVWAFILVIYLMAWLSTNLINQE
ncbi:spermidine synthase [Thermodesulfobacteriota bacterium]